MVTQPARITGARSASQDRYPFFMVGSIRVRHSRSAWSTTRQSPLHSGRYPALNPSQIQGLFLDGGGNSLPLRSGQGNPPILRKLAAAVNTPCPLTHGATSAHCSESHPQKMKHAKSRLFARPLPPSRLAYAHKSKPETPPPSRGRLGGGWGKKDTSEFNLLKMTHEFNPIPTLTLPLKGRELDARRFLNMISLLGRCVHTVALRGGLPIGARSA